MERLTHKRVNGIKQGYWTAAKKDELVERLAAYEDTGLTPEEIMDGKMLTGWIPCIEKLPDKKGVYLTSLSGYNNIKYINIYEFDPTNQSIVNFFKTNICAWQPLPEPWEGDKE